MPELKKVSEYSIWAEDGALHFDVAPAGFQITAHDAEILSLLEGGMSYEEIGHRLGVNKSTVSRRLKKLRDAASDAGVA